MLRASFFIIIFLLGVNGIGLRFELSGNTEVVTIVWIRIQGFSKLKRLIFSLYEDLILLNSGNPVNPDSDKKLLM